ncbi:hypothetical protein GCM10010168_13450 [Actinoplanes ianthinogenes]|uniref:Uncharacterized protein n=1 Tax=Actinoplanes ianthinogenes TaxID=122358 RepID=A0ABM7LZ34_9ACTN|nr:hypothetical protein [Actinoplanes ianthinogenes]BCJ44532.1 hypothetical protein Aiant_51890 [Actinoplanes ianthinogenes]GGQ98575.1 hypothetical protein GCM10010168_13450 [Actinoplanes ianthinogenes]
MELLTRETDHEGVEEWLIQLWPQAYDIQDIFVRLCKVPCLDAMSARGHGREAPPG